MQPERLGIDRYELLRPLGSGGMGTVFEARDLSTGGRLAIKALHEGAGATLYQFKNEFRVLSELSHPFLVRFGELFEDAGRFYLTMELVEGENFLDHARPGSTRPGERPELVPHDGVLDVARLRHALRQLASGLMALHASGVIHRDVKPQNVLVTREARVVLLDFGVAVSKDKAQRPELAGTVAYMAPEQIRGSGVTEAADWYAVGVVLYESLTGRLPHGGLPVWSQARKAKPAPPRSAGGPALPEDLCALCMGLLEPDAARRMDEASIARLLDLDAGVERSRASLRSQLHYSGNVFVNRAVEMGLLRQAQALARSEGCTIVRIIGESGVGKTALLRRWLGELAGDSDAKLVLSSRCYERETLPYRGVDGVVDALARTLGDNAYRRESVPTPRDATLLGQVFPVLRAVAEFEGSGTPDVLRHDPQEARRLAFSALRELLASLSLRRPIVVHVDDAQWIDPESVALLSFLVVGDAAPQMLVVFTERPSNRDVLAELGAARAVTSFELRGLGTAESKLLASELLRGRGACSDGLATAVAQKSGGHPLFIHELVRHAEPGGSAGASLETALAARIALLDAACRGLLEVVALASSPLAHEVVRSASGLDPIAYPRALSTLRGENLATFHGLAGGDEVHTYHDRIRDLVIGTMGPDRQRDLHLRLGSAIEARRPGQVDALAYHFFEGGEHEKAITYARAAAENALAKLAFEHAARFFQLALRVERDPAARGDLEEQLGRTFANAGRGVDAAAAYLRASELAHGTAAKELRRRAGEQLFRAGHVERAMAILSEILRDLGLRIPKTDLGTVASLASALLRLQVRLYLRGLTFEPRSSAKVTPEQRLRLDACWTVATGLSMVHHLRATDYEARSLLLALDIGEEDTILKAAALLSASLGADSTAKRIGRRLMADARALAAGAPSAENDAWIDLTAGASAMGDWEFERCVIACERAESAFRKHCMGVDWEVVYSQAFALWSKAFQGDFKAVTERLPDLLASARARGDRHALATLTLSPLHLAGLAADEPGRVRAECNAIASEWPRDFACFQHYCAEYVLAQVDLYEGRPDEAWKHVEECGQLLRRSHLSRVQFQRVDLLGLRGRTAVAQGTMRGGARRWLALARADARRLERIGIDSARGSAALIEGCVLRAEGQKSAAIERFAVASAHFETRGMRLHVQVARLARGLTAGNALDRDRAMGDLGGLGVVQPRRMMDVWAPGFEK